MTAAPTRAARRWGEVALAVIVYVGATTYFTWPLGRALSDHIADVTGVLVADVMALIWILTWVAHALVSDPSRLFDGNALHPAPRIIAASEHMLGDQLVFAPVWLLTGNPVLAFNLLTLSSFVLAALFMHLAVRRWTGSTAAAYTAGLAFAFAPWRIDLGRPHLLQVQYFPLILFLLDRAAIRGSVLAAVGAAAALALQVLCSYYIGYMAYAAVAAAYVVADLAVRRVRGRAASQRAIAVALLAPLAVIVPLTWPYLSASQTGALPFVIDARMQETFEMAGAPREVVRVYIGWGTLVLGLIGACSLARRRSGDTDDRVRRLGLLLAAAAALVLAPGPGGLAGGWIAPYPWLQAIVPGFSKIRAPARFGCVAGFALSALAGLAVGDTRRWRARARASAIAPLALATVLVPMLTARPLWTAPISTGDDVPTVYRWLAEHGDGHPLLEVPIGPRLGIFRARRAAAAMYFSTYHWLPLLNGHTSYPPASYALLENYAAQLPSAAALRLLADCTGLRWILVHDDTLQRRQAWTTQPGVRLRAIFPTSQGLVPDALYEVLLPPRPGCTQRLFDPGVTLEGHTLVSVPRFEGRITVAGLGESVTAGAETSITVGLENEGSTMWPGPAVAAGRVALSARWTSAGDGTVRAFDQICLPADVVPGRPLAFTTWIRHPLLPGPYVVTLRASQGVDAGEGPNAVEWQGAITVTPRGGGAVPGAGGAPGPPPARPPGAPARGT